MSGRKWESASERTKDPTDIRPDDVAHQKWKSASERTKDSTDVKIFRAKLATAGTSLRYLGTLKSGTATACTGAHQPAPLIAFTSLSQHTSHQLAIRLAEVGQLTKLRTFLDTCPDVSGEVYLTHSSVPWTRGGSATPNLIGSDTSTSPFDSPRPPGSWTMPSLGPDAGGIFNIGFESTSRSYTQMTARAEADRSRTDDSNISEILPEPLDA